MYRCVQPTSATKYSATINIVFIELENILHQPEVWQKLTTNNVNQPDECKKHISVVSTYKEHFINLVFLLLYFKLYLVRNVRD